MPIYDRLREYFHHPLVEYLLDFSIDIIFGPLVLSAGFDVAQLLDRPLFIRGEGHIEMDDNPDPQASGYDFAPLLYRVTGLGFSFQAIVYRYPPR